MYSVRSGKFWLLSPVGGIQIQWGGILDQYLGKNHAKSKLLR